MHYTKLGETKLKVSVAGLGCGGYSRLGLGLGKSEDNAIEVVKTALNMGVNFFDTAEAYGTETVLGKGLALTKRDDIILSTKFSFYDWKTKTVKAQGSLTDALDQSLKKLKTDYVDVYHFHGATPDNYDTLIDRFHDEMDDALKSGKVRCFGISESFLSDTSHNMLKNAIQTDLFKVIMVGYNMMNFSAKNSILPIARAKGIGTLDMFAVRNAFSKKDRLIEIIKSLIDNKEVDPSLFDLEEPLGFIVSSGAAKSIMDAAYRFCRHTNGMDAILTGTSNPKHLEDNIKSILAPPLPKDVLDRIDLMFNGVDSITGQ